MSGNQMLIMDYFKLRNELRTRMVQPWQIIYIFFFFLLKFRLKLVRKVLE